MSRGDEQAFGARLRRTGRLRLRHGQAGHPRPRPRRGSLAGGLHPGLAVRSPLRRRPAATPRAGCSPLRTAGPSTPYATTRPRPIARTSTTGPTAPTSTRSPRPSRSASSTSRCAAVSTASPALQREAVDLAYYKGFTYAEVAESLSANPATVKTRMRDGLVRLRDCLGVEA